jgi:hypothetical protein
MAAKAEWLEGELQIGCGQRNKLFLSCVLPHHDPDKLEVQLSSEHRCVWLTLDKASAARLAEQLLRHLKTMI